MSEQPDIDFAIITALPLEAKAIVKRLQNHETRRFEEKDIRTYHLGTIPIDGKDQAYRVVVVVLPNMGENHAAIAVTDTIAQWHPRFVLLMGIAGGLPQDDLSLGDVVVAEQVIGYEYSKETDKGIQHRDRVYPASGLLLDGIRNYWDDKWAEHVGMEMPARSRRKKPKVFTGPIASGNKVIASTEFRNMLLARWPKLIAVEMEAEGFYTATYNRPQIAGALVIRGISDMADKRKSDRWQEYAANAAAAFLVGFLSSGPFDPAPLKNAPAPETSDLSQKLSDLASGQTNIRELALQADRQGFGGQYDLLEKLVSLVMREGYSLEYDANHNIKINSSSREASENKIDPNVFVNLSREITRLYDAITGHIPDEKELAALADRYRKHIIRWFERLTFQGMMRTAQVISLPLEDLYVELRAVAEVPEAADTFSVEERRLLLELKENDDQSRKELFRQFDALRKERWSRAKLERKSIIDALYSSERRAFIVLGDPGSGKSTLLHFLAVVFARGPQAVVERLHLPPAEGNRLPIFLPLAAFDDMLRTQPGLNLLHFLGQYYEQRRGLPGLGHLFQHALESGEALVLMDGLDEILEPTTRQYVAAQVSALIDEYCPRGTRFVLTSRFVGYREAPVGRDLPHLSVIDFGDAEIKTFIHQWANVYEVFASGGVETPESLRKAREAEDDLLKDVNSIDSVRRLAANPLMLTMLALLRRQVGRLPHRRIELYQRYMATMLENWVQMRTQGEHASNLNLLDPHKAESMLIPLAYWLQSERPSGTASGKDIEEALVSIILKDAGIDPLAPSQVQRKDALEQARRFLHEMRYMNGLIVERGYDAYGFLHLTFQEYFAGRALAQMEPAERQKNLIPYLHDPRWREPILLCAGQLGVIEKRRGQVSEFVRQILKCSDETEVDLHRNLLLALSIAGDDVNLEPPLIEELVKEAFQCLPTKVYAFAEEIFQRVGQIFANHSTQSEEYLTIIWMLGDANLRKIAVERLSNFVLDSAIFRSLLLRLKDEDNDVRAAAVRVLAPLASSDENLCQALLLQLEDEHFSVRATAMRALAPLASSKEGIRQALLLQIENQYFYMRTAAADALGPLASSDEDIRQALLLQLEDKLYDVRVAVLNALAPLASRDEGIRQALLLRFEDKAESVRAAAMRALAPLMSHDEGIRQALLLRLEDEVAFVRAVAVDGLAPLASREESIRQALLLQIEDEHDIVRGAAVGALAPLISNDRNIRSLFESKLNDLSWQLRRNVIMALSESLYDANIVKYLLPMLLDITKNLKARESSKFTQRIIIALSPKCFIPQVRQALLLQLKDRNNDVRAAAVRGLAPLVSHDESIRQALLLWLEDKDESVRMAVVSALGPLVSRDEGIRQALLLRLENNLYDVRAAAVSALGPLISSDESIRQALLLRLEDEHKNVQMAAVGALGPLASSDEDIRQALLLRLEDKDDYVRMAVLNALAPLVSRDKGIRQALLLRLEDKMYNVRAAAVRGLAPLVSRDEGIRQALLLRLEDKDDFVQGTAMGALASLVKSDEKIRQALLPRLEDESEYVRAVAVSALAPLASREESIRQALLLLLDGDNEYVRAAAVGGLAPLISGDEGIRQALLLRLEDEAEYVRAAVVSALAPLASREESIRQALLLLLEDPFWRVRKNAFAGILKYGLLNSNIEQISQSEKLIEWLFQDVDERFEFVSKQDQIKDELMIFSTWVGKQLPTHLDLQNKVLTGLESARGSIRLGCALALLAWPVETPHEYLLRILDALNNPNELASYPARLEAAGFLINRDPYSSEAISLCLEALEYGTKPWEYLPDSKVVREQAAQILGKLEMIHYDDRVYQKLRAVMLEDENDEVRDAAYGALLRLARLRPSCP